MSTKKGHVIRKEVKEQILERLKDEGIPVVKLAEEHGTRPSTIYNRLGGQPTGSNTLELARPRRESQMLKQLIGHLALQTEGSEKKKTRRRGPECSLGDSRQEGSSFGIGHCPQRTVLQKENTPER